MTKLHEYIERVGLQRAYAKTGADLTWVTRESRPHQPFSLHLHLGESLLRTIVEFNPSDPYDAMFIEQSIARHKLKGLAPDSPPTRTQHDDRMDALNHMLDNIAKQYASPPPTKGKP